MRARIYQPSRNAMQSGMGKTKTWILEFAPTERREVDPLMGWTGSGDMSSQVRLRFESCEAAQDYAREHGIDAVVLRTHKRKANVRARGYGENFATDRRQVWTH
ncbi:ETC complex I subunit [Nioella nitratireducens]|uniref:ETC complex I subunit n=1 Tax=Nioella nitratireducens TaxID=1287720 RepID=UPI0008FD2B78|nr:ETC complex I subunit [Nioella nitratireducens]